MTYTIDIKKISLEDYREILRHQDLLPSRKILQQDLDTNFEAILSLGVSNLHELKSSFSTPKKMDAISNQSKIPLDYLKILKRELGSLIQKPVPIKDFPDLSEDIIDKLKKAQIKSSKDFFEMYSTINDANEIVRNLNLSPAIIDELISLCTLVRINGVGAIAAKVFFEAGYKSLSDIINANPQEMLKKISDINSVKKYYKATLGVKDMQFCIDFAKVMIEFS